MFTIMSILYAYHCKHVKTENPFGPLVGRADEIGGMMVVVGKPRICAASVSGGGDGDGAVHGDAMDHGVDWRWRTAATRGQGERDRRAAVAEWRKRIGKTAAARSSVAVSQKPFCGRCVSLGGRGRRRRRPPSCLWPPSLSPQPRHYRPDRITCIPSVRRAAPYTVCVRAHWRYRRNHIVEYKIFIV